VDRERRSLRVQRAEDLFDTPIWAQLAIAGASDPPVGSRVLVAGDGQESNYVIGVLDAPAEPSPSRQVETGSGAVAVASGCGDSEQLAVVSESGQLLFEYEPASRRMRVHLHEGDVQFVAHDGELEFVADRGIRFASRGAVQVQAEQGVHLEAAEADSLAASSLRLDPHRTRLTSRHLALAGEHLDATAGELQVTSRQVVARSRRARLAIESLEAVFGTIMQKATHAFTSIAELCQLRAKHSQTVIEESSHHQAGRMVIKADEDVKINGEQIHLG
jgi:hypothetical protein